MHPSAGAVTRANVKAREGVNSQSYGDERGHGPAGARRVREVPSHTVQTCDPQAVHPKLI